MKELGCKKKANLNQYVLRIDLRVERSITYSNKQWYSFPLCWAIKMNTPGAYILPHISALQEAY